MDSKIEEVIEDLQEYIDACKFLAFSSTKIVASKDELEQYVNELSLRVPEEIKKSQQIVSQQDAILSDARTQAQNMIQDARGTIDRLVSDHEIMQRAYQRANEVIEDARKQAEEIVSKAYDDANDIRQGAVQYTDNLLENIQNIISDHGEESRKLMDEMFRTLQTVFDECAANRNNLSNSISYQDVKENQETQ